MSLHLGMLLLRSLIVLSYVAVLFPWVLFYFTGFWLFGLLGVTFALLGIGLIPIAINDWSYPK